MFSPVRLEAMDDEERRRRMCAGKTRYRDEAAAQVALHNIEWDQSDSGGSLRTYRCDYCDRWHLTSQPRR